LRLLLDEHYSPKVAEALRARGHDVVAVAERAELRRAGDREVWTRAVAESRAVVTEDAADFNALIREAAAAGEHHFGVVFTSRRSMPRSSRTIGLYVERLDALLRERPAVDALADQVEWLA
jgi:Domain of unknown function (DUF5615)